MLGRAFTARNWPPRWAALCLRLAFRAGRTRPRWKSIARSSGHRSQLDRPYAMPGMSVIAAETDEEARFLFTSTAAGLRQSAFGPAGPAAATGRRLCRAAGVGRQAMLATRSPARWWVRPTRSQGDCRFPGADRRGRDHRDRADPSTTMRAAALSRSWPMSPDWLRRPPPPNSLIKLVAWPPRACTAAGAAFAFIQHPRADRPGLATIAEGPHFSIPLAAYGLIDGRAGDFRRRFGARSRSRARPRTAARLRSALTLVQDLSTEPAGLAGIAEGSDFTLIHRADGIVDGGTVVRRRLWRRRPRTGTVIRSHRTGSQHEERRHQ
jgi:hypothetical protein